MKLRDILNDMAGEHDPDVQISVVVEEQILVANGIALESIWQSAGKGWVFRVDPKDPKIPQLRHIHICKDKHKNAKSMQAAWNDNGTRHDKKTFNDDVGNRTFVRDLARRVLKIGPDIALESMSAAAVSIIDDVTFSQDGREAFVRFQTVLSKT